MHNPSWALIIGSVCVAGITSAAAAATIPIGEAANYAILYEGTGGHNLQVTNVSIVGSIGVGGTGHVQDSGPSSIFSNGPTNTGSINFAAANSGQFANNNGSNVIAGGVNYNVSAVTNALNTVNNLSISLAGLGNTPSSNIAINGTQTINESAGQLDTVNGVTYRVFNVTSYSSGDGKLLTINGDGSGTPVVFDFGFDNNVNLGGDVALTGGLTDDQVLWNFTTSGKNISLNNNASSYSNLAFHGIILAPNDPLAMTNANLDGRIFGGDSSDFQYVSGSLIDAPPPTSTPLPASAGSGLTLLGLLAAGKWSNQRRRTLGLATL